MATLKVLNQKGKYHDLEARATLVHYILDPRKMPHGLYGSAPVELLHGPDFIKSAVASMNEVAVRFHKQTGTQLRHSVLAFEPSETRDAFLVDQIARQVVAHLGETYQMIYGVHENTQNLHIHFMMNPVSYLDGKRYYGTKKEYYDLLSFLKALLGKYGFYLITVSGKSERDIQGDELEF